LLLVAGGRLRPLAWDFDDLGVTPQTIEIVIGASFLGENVDQVVAIVCQNPLGILEALDTDRMLTMLVKLTADLFGDGLNLLGVATGGDDEKVGERGDFAQIQYPDVGGFLRFSGAGSDEPRRS
jgi:hypothetical protein